VDVVWPNTYGTDSCLISLVANDLSLQHFYPARLAARENALGSFSDHGRRAGMDVAMPGG
jgi:hypothetical protein